MATGINEEKGNGETYSQQIVSSLSFSSEDNCSNRFTLFPFLQLSFSTDIVVYVASCIVAFSQGVRGIIRYIN